jgi:hypothetical protein
MFPNARDDMAPFAGSAPMAPLNNPPRYLIQGSFDRFYAGTDHAPTKAYLALDRLRANTGASRSARGFQ